VDNRFSLHVVNKDQTFDCFFVRDEWLLIKWKFVASVPLVAESLKKRGGGFMLRAFLCTEDRDFDRCCGASHASEFLKLCLTIFH